MEGCLPDASQIEVKKTISNGRHHSASMEHSVQEKVGRGVRHKQKQAEDKPNA